MQISFRFWLPAVVVALLISCLQVSSAPAEELTQRLSIADGARPFLQILNGSRHTFELSGVAKIEIDKRPQPIEFRLTRFDQETFDLILTHADYAVEIRRRHDATMLVLPKHKVVMVGRGEIPKGHESLTPRALVGWLVSQDSDLAKYVQMVSTASAEIVEAALVLGVPQLEAEAVPGSGQYTPSADSPLQFPSIGEALYRDGNTDIHVRLSSKTSPATKPSSDCKEIEIPRTELERTLVRGVHRATEILQPGHSLKHPELADRKVPHGELRWIEGQRVAILHGSPQQIGEAHGQLLKRETLRCIESVLYSFGTAHAIRTGRWFRSDLQAAYARLSPHIPQRHHVETRSLATAIDLPEETVAALNVFPELFHCSGFAAFGSATADGKLYHGRVLDYMTTIGLQDAATTFVVQPDGYIPFANVGYAGFIGSVSGMNAKAISLGEMGGGGEGQWDGAPMATLMRRSLEECSTLKEVMTLWTESPRTCEYYYVFADGKTNEAVGVAALPESIEFISPGQDHERLGSGIPDTVVLSAGSRLETLRQRVTEKHGTIDSDVGKWLMSRPVAMQSNLHNVLFVPQDGVFYVANASHSKPAAERPYVRLSLPKLLNSVAELSPATVATP